MDNVINLSNKIKKLTKELNKELKKINNKKPVENNKLELVIEEKPKETQQPLNVNIKSCTKINTIPAGRRGTRLDNTIISWKNSLRFPY